MKKIISVLLSFLMFITSIFICNTITANAADTANENYIVCEGYYIRNKGSYQIRLDITTNKARQMSAGLYIFVEKLSILCYNKRNIKDLDGKYGF